MMRKFFTAAILVLSAAQTSFGVYAYIDCYGPVCNGLTSYNIYLWADSFEGENINITNFTGSISGTINYSNDDRLDTHFLLSDKGYTYSIESNDSIEAYCSISSEYQSNVITLAQVVTPTPEYGDWNVSFSLDGYATTTSGQCGAYGFILTPPIDASILYSSSSIGPGQTLTLNANADCSQEDIDTYLWDLDDDGDFDDASTATLYLDYDYLVNDLGLTTGEHIIRLKVKAGDFSYRNYSYLSIVPEPISLFFLFAGGLFLSRRK